MFNTVVNLINDKFFFIDEASRQIWEDNINKHSAQITTFQEYDRILADIDTLLLTLHDPHTRLCYSKSDVSLYPADLLWCNNTLYLSYCGQALAVEGINGFRIEELWKQYVNKYVGYSDSLIRNILLSDIKYGLNSFKSSELEVLVTTKGRKDIISFSPHSLKELRKNTQLVLSQYNNSPMFQWPLCVVPIENDILLIKIVSFHDKELVNKFIGVISEFNYYNIIIDVRDNVGGYTDVTESLTGLFINKDTSLDYKIVERVGSNYASISPIIKANLSPMLKDRNIIVFANSNTMSSAEYIFVNALKKCGYPIAGEITCGHPNRAAVFQLSSDINLQITNKRFYNESGIVKCGISPCFSVIQSPSDYAKGIDSFVKWYKEIYL